MIYELVTIVDGKEIDRKPVDTYEAAAMWFRQGVALAPKSMSFQVIACPADKPFPMSVLNRSWVAMRS